MAGSIYGDLFRISTWGESHGRGIGVVIDGCPAGVPLTEETLQKLLDRRKPGQNQFSTQRNEADRAEILSGVFEGKTEGTPISVIIRNSDQHSGDYSSIMDKYRPGHADMPYDEKYGFRDYRGGGRSSGRETAGRVAAGAVAEAVLRELGIEVTAYVSAIGNVKADHRKINKNNILKSSIYMPDLEASAEAEQLIQKCREEKDSIGGSVECVITGLPAGIGDPVFDKLDSCLAKAVMSIGAVKAVSIGDGFSVSSSRGSENNDSFISLPAKLFSKAEKEKKISASEAENKFSDQMENSLKLLHEGRFFDDEGHLISFVKSTNHAGGILGGISDSDPVLVTASIKPTPSIARKQITVDKNGNLTEMEIKGRHDPVIAPRAAVVVESMAAVTVLDLLLKSLSSNIGNIKRIFER